LFLDVSSHCNRTILMNHDRRIRRVVHATLAALLLGGCGDDAATPTTDQAEVTGTVTYEGKPVPVDTSVLFSCQDIAANAAGKVDSLGNYTLRAADSSVGIPVGRYKVIISPPSSAGAAPAIGTPEYEQMMQQGGTREAPPPPKEIPEEFMSPDTTPIVLELKAGPQTYDFDLAELSK
jgi:hypothetical protein